LLLASQDFVRTRLREPPQAGLIDMLLSMPDPQVVLQSLAGEYEEARASNAYLILYGAQAAPLNAVFALLHERLNNLLQFMNTKIDRGRHYNADQSRDLIELIDEIRRMRGTLARIGIHVRVRDDYDRVIEECSSFLVPSGGSAIPDSFEKIEVDRFEPVFLTEDWTPPAATAEPPTKSMVGEGSFAIVYKYTEPTYGFPIATKVARRGLSERELARFRAEFDVLKKVRFPYVVEAFHYDAAGPAFTMEYCDSNLGDYISRNNATLTFTARRRIALQFLYGVNYLHQKGILHRDISRGNVLIKTYDLNAVVVKLSDFGLHKPEGSEFTQSETEMKGTIRDPTLANFKDFAVVNDIYAVGHIIAYIFTGKKSITECPEGVQVIVDKCTDNNPSRRYSSVAHVIAALEVVTGGNLPLPAGAPA